jgi:hypothetical protein
MTALNFPASPSDEDTYDNFIYDAAKGAWKLQTLLGNDLDDLNDVTIDTPTTGQALTYDGSEWVNATPASTVDSLTDTTITTPANEESLVYDTSTSKWINDKRIINTDGDPGTKIYIGSTDPSGAYALQVGDFWIETL